jgi:MFS family permease
MIFALSKVISDTLKTITIEPVIFLFQLGSFILSGAQIPTNVLIYKICHIELNYTNDICDNLGDDSNKLIQEEVQVQTNNFQMNAQWITSVPGILFSLYAGPLSDKFGRKPLLMFPIVGYIFSAIGGMINYSFLNTLPLEFFYIETLPAFFGGLVVYYLGMYGYGASVSEPEERAHRIARLDGTETLATVAGTLLSPLVNEHLGPIGNYGLFGGFSLLSAIYLKFCVREPIKNKSDKKLQSEESSQSSGVLYTTLVMPLMDMKTLLVKPRKRILTILILIQLIVYCAYIFGFNSTSSLLYLYMLVRFENFQPDDFAYFSVTLSLCSVFFLIVFMPIVSGRLRLSDALLLTLLSIAETLGFLLSPFTSNLTLFYIFQVISTIGNCKFSIGRSLLSKCCESDEVGKMFSILSILLSLTFMISNPIVRQLYNLTIDHFPGAFLLLIAALLVVSGFGNFFVYLKQSKLIVSSDKCEKEFKFNNVELNNEEFTKF